MSSCVNKWCICGLVHFPLVMLCLLEENYSLRQMLLMFCLLSIHHWTEGSIHDIPRQVPFRSLAIPRPVSLQQSDYIVCFQTMCWDHVIDPVLHHATRIFSLSQKKSVWTSFCVFFNSKNCLNVVWDYFLFIHFMRYISNFDNLTCYWLMALFSQICIQWLSSSLPVLYIEINSQEREFQQDIDPPFTYTAAHTDYVRNSEELTRDQVLICALSVAATLHNTLPIALTGSATVGCSVVRLARLLIRLLNNFQSKINSALWKIRSLVL